MAIEALDLRDARAAVSARPAEAPIVNGVPADGSVSAGRKREFSAAQMGRLTMDCAMSILSRDQKLWTDLSKLRSRSRELAGNDPTAAKFLSLCQVNVIGMHGMKL